jgi:c-di-GMP-related signal transduction protein
LMLVSDISEATEEQLTAMMSRARLCQLVAERLDVPPDTAFTVGLLASVVDLVAEPVEDLMTRLPVTAEIIDALRDGRGRLGEVLAMVRAYEDSDLTALAAGPVSSADMARAYLSAIGWSTTTVNGVLGGRAARRLPPPSALKRPIPEG